MVNHRVMNATGAAAGIFLVLAAGCGASPVMTGGTPARNGIRAFDAADPEIAVLREIMVGSFSSAKQAASNPSYVDVRLHVAPMWLDRPDGPWLYVEQAVATALERPYRQRVYRLSRVDPAQLRSTIYTIPEPLRFAGDWKKAAPLASLQPENLDERKGCEVFISKVGPQRFEGRTLGKNCPSDLRGASYATTEVTLEPGRLVSWDRGWDLQGKQAWGAVAGGYVFDKE
jgi:hypothetical protein